MPQRLNDYLWNAIDLRAIAQLGGGFSVSASAYPVTELKAFAQLAATGPGKPLIIITGAKTLDVVDLKAIAILGKGSVHFEF